MSRPSEKHYYTLRSGLTIFPEHYKIIDQLLANLVQKIPARFVVLTDVSGQLISSRGDQDRINLVALGSLIAGDLAASQEIARLTGEYQDYQMILREGRMSHTLITEASHHLALLAQIPGDVPLGWARMMIRETAHQLAKILEEPLEPIESLEPESILTEEELTNLFDNALDDLWLE